jgi:hypothetical protein
MFGEFKMASVSKGKNAFGPKVYRYRWQYWFDWIDDSRRGNRRQKLNGAKGQLKEQFCAEVQRR